MIRPEFDAVEQNPEDVAESLVGAAAGVFDIGQRLRQFEWPGADQTAK